MSPELLDRICGMNFGQRTKFIFALRKVAGDGWEYIEDCPDEDIEAAFNLVEEEAR